MPELDAVKAFYVEWFEREYGIKPQANCTPAAAFALAAMRHFSGATETELTED